MGGSCEPRYLRRNLRRWRRFRHSTLIIGESVEGNNGRKGEKRRRKPEIFVRKTAVYYLRTKAKEMSLREMKKVEKSAG